MFDWGIVATNKKKNFHHEAGNPSVAPPDSRDAGDCRQSKIMRDVRILKP